MDIQRNSDKEIESTCFYSIRLLITHPTMSADDVTTALGMEPDNSWNAGERSFTPDMKWGYTSWTEGKRLFFDEVHVILEWLQEEKNFLSRLLNSGGIVQVIVQLPGSINIGDSVKFETLSLALKLGVAIGIEVFPNLVKPKSDK